MYQSGLNNEAFAEILRPELLFCLLERAILSLIKSLNIIIRKRTHLEILVNKQIFSIKLACGG